MFGGEELVLCHLQLVKGVDCHLDSVPLLKRARESEGPAVTSTKIPLTVDLVFAKSGKIDKHDANVYIYRNIVMQHLFCELQHITLK